MEVSPEVYAWFSALNIIDPFSETGKNRNKNYYIPEDILNALFNGEHMSTLILDLQSAYNKYYQIKKDCSPKLKELVFKERNFDSISEKTKINNWNVINDALKIFDIKYSKNDLNKIVNGNNEILLKILSNLFNIVTKYLKYAKKDTVISNNNKSPNKNKNIREHNNLNLNLNFSSHKKSSRLSNDTTSKKSNKNENFSKTDTGRSDFLKNINKNNSENSLSNNLNSLSNLVEPYAEPLNNISDKQNNNSENNNINDMHENSNKNNIHRDNNSKDILNSKKPLTEYVDVNKISEDTLYEKCTSTLEFFIVSLCKNFKIKPVQAIGLLSNNRQYLSVLCRSGINGNYITIKKWLEDLQIYYDILLKLIFKYEDGVYMTYCIIGTALCSKNYDISLDAINLLNQIFKNVGINKDWFIKIGINSFIFVFIKHNEKLLYFLNIMCEFIKNDESIFFNEIKNKMKTDEEYQILVYDLLINIIPVSKKINNRNFFNMFKDFVFDLCLHEEKKLTYSCSVLCESFFHYTQIIDNEFADKIILFFKKCLRSHNSNIYGSTIAKLFILITNLSNIYDQYGPHLYKILVSLFIEMYDELEKREIFLLNFIQFLKSHKQMPLDIFFEPFINKLSDCENYSLCDFLFLSKIIEHPRFEFNDINNVLNFILNVSLNNNFYNKCAIFVLEKILDEIIPNKNFDERQMEDLSILFIDYMNQTMEIYMINGNNNNMKGNLTNENENENSEDKNEHLLEMCYVIIQHNFGEVNSYIKIKIVECAKNYYYEKGKHSGILLGMLKKYEDFGDILFEIEQE